MVQNLYYIISDDKKVETNIAVADIRAAIFVCLYYEDQIVDYQKYLNDIPDFVDVYIISSKEEILNRFDDKRFFTIQKDNRGRDISALLISAKLFIFQYDYICFIHDKKEKTPETKPYIDFWRKILWQNMIGSGTYIYNILELFESKKELGMLVPIPPHKGDKGVWLRDAWGKDFENTKNIAKELGLDIAILKENQPISISTVFWTRTETLKKLYLKQWNYTDFPEEPMKNDGEINHAIERVLQYVVEDAGYEIKIAISSTFASLFFQQMHDELQYLWENLNRQFGIRTYRDIEYFNDRLEQIKVFGHESHRIFLYGAGIRGRDCLAMCKVLDIIPKGFLVTDSSTNQSDVDGIPIISIEHYVPNDSDGIIITVGKTYQAEIVRELEKRGITGYMIF